MADVGTGGGDVKQEQNAPVKAEDVSASTAAPDANSAVPEDTGVGADGVKEVKIRSQVRIRTSFSLGPFPFLCRVFPAMLARLWFFHPVPCLLRGPNLGRGCPSSVEQKNDALFSSRVMPSKGMEKRINTTDNRLATQK